jgi:hypothetical protein
MSAELRLHVLEQFLTNFLVPMHQPRAHAKPAKDSFALTRPRPSSLPHPWPLDLPPCLRVFVAKYRCIPYAALAAGVSTGAGTSSAVSLERPPELHTVTRAASYSLKNTGSLLLNETINPSRRSLTISMA